MVACVASSFAPYVGRFRLEQIALFAAVVVLLLAVGFRPVWTRSTVAILALLTFFLLFSGLVALVGTAHSLPYPPRGIPAGVDTVVTAGAGILLGAAALRFLHAWQLARIIVVSLSVLLSLNTIIALNQTAWSGLLLRFWTSSGSDSVAVLAETNVRYSGVFNQPLEAGLAYSVALLGLWLLPQVRVKYALILSPFVTLGGILSGSKVFFLSLFILGIALLVQLGRKEASRALALIPVALVSLGVVGLLGSATFTGALERISGRGDDTLSGLTAGRLGSQGTLWESTRELRASRLLYGAGLGGLEIPYDSVWVEALVLLGLIGVVVMLVIFLLLGRGAFTGGDPSGRLFNIALFALLVGGSLGAPVLTANRVASWLWILIVATILAPANAGFRLPMPSESNSPGPAEMSRARAVANSTIRPHAHPPGQVKRANLGQTGRVRPPL